MRKLKAIVLCLFALTFLVTAFACTDSSETTTTDGENVTVDYANIDKVEIGDAETLSQTGFSLDVFKLSDITLIITYNSGDTVSIPVTDTMVRAEDKAKLSIAGTHSVTLDYGRFTVNFNLKLYTAPKTLYAVSFLNTEGNRVADVQYLAAGERALEPKLGTVEGYTFVGWKNRETGAMVTDFTFTADTTLIAVFAPDYYDIGYYYTVGEKSYLITTVSVARGGDAVSSAPEIPVVAGYSNGRWSDETAMEKIDGSVLSFYAVYDADSVPVTFSYYKNVEGEYYDRIFYWNVNRETEGITPPDDVENVDDYVFCYWYIARGNDKIKVSFPYKVTAEVTFTAYYIPFDKGTDGLSYVYENSGYTVSGFNVSDDTEVVIPDYYYTEAHGTLPVKGVTAGAFADAEVTGFAVSADNKYLRVYDDALYTADNSEFIAFPNALERETFSMNKAAVKIDAGAFENCLLKNLTLSPFVTEIGEYAFANCGNLVSLVIPEGVKTIEKGLMSGDCSAVSVAFGDGVTEIKDEAFSDMNSLSSVTLSSKLVSLGKNVFSGCASLSKISMPQNTEFSIENGALYGKSGSNEHYYLYAYPALFSGNSDTEYEIDNEVRCVVSGAFSDSRVNGLYFPTSILTLETGSIVVPGLISVRFGATAVRLCDGVFGEYTPKTVYVSDSTSLTDDGGAPIVAYENAAFVKYEENSWTGYRDYALGFAYTTQDKNAVITSYAGSATDIVVPASIGTYTVKEIAAYAFYGSGVVSVALPDSVTKIGEYAFADCIGLKSVTLGGGLKEVGAYAFSECPNVETLDDGGAAVTTVGEGAFFGMTPNGCGDGMLVIAGILVSGGEVNGATVEIPSAVTVIGYEAFCGAAMLCVDFSAAAGLAVISDRAFYGCSELVSATLPDSLKTVGEYAFGSCSALNTVITGENFSAVVAPTAYDDTPYKNGSTVKHFSISGTTLVAYSGASEKVIIPAGITVIGEGAFENNASLETVYIGGTVVSIKGNAFYGCGNLVKAVIGDTVVSIGDGAFGNCSKLGSVSVGAGVSEISHTAFDGTEWLDKYADDAVSINGIFYRYLGDMSEYHVMNSIVKINEYAFYGNTSLEIVYIPESVKEIGAYAFYGADVQAFNFSSASKLVSIGEYAFFKCDNLSYLDLSGLSVLSEIGTYAFAETASPLSSGLHVTIPAKVVSVGTGAFSESGLYTVRFAAGSKLEIIAERAFYGCVSLESVIFDGADNLYEIGASAFENCLSLKTFINTASNLESIGEKAFYGDAALEIFQIDDYGVVSVGTDAFTGVKYIEDNDDTMVLVGTALVKYNGVSSAVFIPSDVTVVSGGAFKGNSYVKSVTVLETDGVCGLSEIQAEAFADCAALESFVIPSSVKTVGKGAFGNCSALKSITIGEGVETLGDYIFENCVSLENVKIPASVTEIGAGAFAGCKKLTAISCETSNAVYSSDKGILYSYTTDFEDSAKNTAVLTAFPYNYTFDGTVVTDFAVPSSVTAKNRTYFVTGIGETAFFGCDGLVSVSIPENVNSIGKYAFGKTAASVEFASEQKITEIGDYAFAMYGGTALTIPDTVITIGVSAFQNCGNLVSLAVPASVKSIGGYAFDGVSASVTWADGSSLADFADYAFYGYKGVSLTIPSGIVKIGEYAFASVTASLSWANGTAIAEIGDYAFASYGGTALSVPDTVAKIGAHAFDGCANVDTVSIPALVSSVGEYAFNGVVCPVTFAADSALRKIDGYVFAGYGGAALSLPSRVTDIAAYAFYGSDKLASIDFGGAPIVSIGDYAFAKTALLSVTVPESVETVGRYAFFDCASLVSAAFGKNPSVSEIGYSAFGSCEKLAYAELPFVGENRNNNRYFGYIFGAESIDDCSDGVPETLSSVVVLGGEIIAKAFYGCSGIISLVFGSNSQVDADSLEGATSLVSLSSPYCGILGLLFGGEKYTQNASVVPSSLAVVTVNGGAVLEAYAFYECVHLRNIYLTDSVTEIGESAFCNCVALNSFDVGANVVKIGEKAFLKCSSLDEIAVNPDNAVFASYDGVLYGYDGGDMTARVISYPMNKSVSSYEIAFRKGSDEYSVVEIGAYAFYFAKTSYIAVPDTVAKIGEYAFSYSAITEIKITTDDIGAGAFNKCGALSKVFISDAKVAAYASDSEDAKALANIYKNTIYVKTALNAGTYIETAYSKLGNTAYDGGVEYNVYYKNESSLFSFSALPERVSGVVAPYGAVTINGEAAGDALKFPEGAEIYLSASVVADDNHYEQDYMFLGWYNGTTKLSLSADYVYEMTASSVELTAEYVRKPAAVAVFDVSAAGNGSVNAYLFYADGYDGDSATAYYYMIIDGTGSMETDWLAAAVDGDGVSWIKSTPYDSYGDYVLSLSVRNGVTNIAPYAFAHFGALLYAEIADSVTSIGADAFAYCVNITALEVPSSVSSIGVSAFENAERLSLLTLGEGVETIGVSAFSGIGARTIALPSTVVSIGDKAFYDCSLLVSIYVSRKNAVYASVDGVVYAYNTDDNTARLAFYPSGKSDTYTIPSEISVNCIVYTVTAVDADAFVSCGKITALDIAPTVLSIGSGAFDGSAITWITADGNPSYAGIDGVLYSYDTATYTAKTVFVPDGLSASSAITVDGKNYTVEQ